MKKHIFLILACLFTACNYHYEDRQLKSIVVAKEYTPPHTSTISVPYCAGKVHGVRLQSVHHPEQYEVTVLYIDEGYTNYGRYDVKEVSEEEYNSVDINDTVLTRCQIKINNK